MSYLENVNDWLIGRIPPKIKKILDMSFPWAESGSLFYSVDTKIYVISIVTNVQI